MWVRPYPVFQPYDGLPQKVGLEPKFARKYRSRYCFGGRRVAVGVRLYLLQCPFPTAKKATGRSSQAKRENAAGASPNTIPSLPLPGMVEWWKEG